MSINTKHSYKLSVKRATRRSRRQQRRTSPSSSSGSSRSLKPTMMQKMKSNCKSSKSKLSQKLEALKNLIPAHNGDMVMKPDQLFQETAHYIVLLRTRVVILQKLIEFYGNSTTSENENVVLL